MTIEALNPATEKVVKQYQGHSNPEILEKIQTARSCFKKWHKVDFSIRAEKMKKVAQILRDNQEKYAKLATQEMGKPIKEARSEVEKCAWVCEYYADHAAQFLANEYIETDASSSYIAYQPLGIVLAVMPWNFPYWQVFRFAAPAIMAGNVGLLKHASNVPGCAEAIEAIFREAGFPEGIFYNLLIKSDQVQMIIEHPNVKAATLTGSEKAGSAVAKTAGKQIKKTVLELGGSDAYLILDDADLEQAASVCTKSRLLNTGQSCIGAKRFIVLESVYDEFLQRFKQKMAAAIMGDPMDEKTDIGPMARADLRDELHEQVVKSIKKGAKCILGGQVPERKGAFYPPTILVDIQPNMPAYEEELFGPVAAVFKVKDEAEAIRIANDSKFGLGAAVFTKNLKRGERIAAHDLEAGSCFVNGLVKSDPRLPFGGIKASGYGRELSHLGIREFTNIKTVWVK